MEPITRGVVHSILEDGPESTARRLAEAPPGASFVEIRADLLRAADVAGLVRRGGPSVIVTVRSKADGGRFDGSAGEKSAILEQALAAGAAWVDVECDGAHAHLADGVHAPRVILSRHGGRCTVDTLRATRERLRATRAGRHKIVPEAASAVEIDALRVVLGDRDGAPLAAFASGEPGRASRVLAISWGSWGTYGAAAQGRETGAGQPTSRELLDVYRAPSIGSATRRFVLFGRGVEASPSPAIHAAGYAALGLDAVYLPIAAEDPAEALTVAAVGGPVDPAGLAVTMPLKLALAERCVRLDASARHGAVNTMLREREGWVGHNTDAPAALAMLSDDLPLAGATVAIAGAGGTARAIGGALGEAGARVSYYTRGASLATLARARWDVLVNATPLGKMGERVVPDEALTGRAVLDAVYAASPTPLVVAARARGLAVRDGYDLLLAQALLQFELLCGHRAPREAMRAALDAFRGAA